MFLNELDENKELKISENELNINLSSLNLNQGQLILRVKTTGTVASKVNLDNLKKEVTGKNQSKARTIIEQLPNFKDAVFKYNPTWYFRRLAPSANSTEIKIEYIFEETSA